MTTWLWILGGLYLAILGYATLYSRRRTRSSDDYVLAGSNVGLFWGFLTFSATVFSTFTLMGMPDFFKTHGVGAWIFLAVADGAVAFLILWFGYHIRRRVAEKGFKGVAGLLNDCYGHRWGGYVYFAGVFLFLIPYVAIQIRGIGIFLNAAFPEALPVWGWATVIVVVMLVYSEVGGLKAIIYSDALQGILLLVVTWIIALGCIRYFGGIGPHRSPVNQADRPRRF
jgi:SSS family solute:Na+ symporter